ncbi:hypothetical protein BJX64DRAFT_174768 [Aspergillus heterothallicus]
MGFLSAFQLNARCSVFHSSHPFLLLATHHTFQTKAEFKLPLVDAHHAGSQDNGKTINCVGKRIASEDTANASCKAFQIPSSQLRRRIRGGKRKIRLRSEREASNTATRLAIFNGGSVRFANVYREIQFQLGPISNYFAPGRYNRGFSIRKTG